MRDLYSPKTIRHLKEKHGFQTTKSLGQNFLTSPAVPEEMAAGAQIGADDLVIEIGPGIGVLTQVLSGAAAWVTAVEVDRRLEPVLEETLEGLDNVEVIWEDVLKVDFHQLIRSRRESRGIRGRTRIAGNLPYYITTPILMMLLEENVEADSITVMMQKEVADRIGASPGGKDYGALSVAVQYRCHVERIAEVPKEVFYPRPKVDSAILHLRMREEKAVQVASEKNFFACVRAGFGQRRKTLANALSSGLVMPKEEIRTILRDAGIQENRRAETLSIDEFARLANAIK